MTAELKPRLPVLVVAVGVVILLALIPFVSRDEDLSSLSLNDDDWPTGVLTDVDLERLQLKLCTYNGPEQFNLKKGLPYGFSFAHLEEHLETGDPVTLELDSDDSTLVRGIFDASPELVEGIDLDPVCHTS